MSDNRSLRCTNSSSYEIEAVQSRRNIGKTDIEELAIRKYRTSGYGVIYVDLMKDLHATKHQAQRSIKYFHDKRVLFTARDLMNQGIYLLDNTNPQQYFPTCMKADILEKLKKRKGIDSDPPRHTILNTTIPPRKYALAYALEYQKAQNFLETLLLLPYRPPFIHKLQVMSHINKRYYAESSEMSGIKKYEIFEEIIGKRHVRYTVSSNGTIQIAIRSNTAPFKLESEVDECIIFSFFGQVRDRLLFLLGDQRELYIPSVMNWILKQCDLNKDVKIDERAQLTLPDIQLTHLSRVFRLYVKIMNGETNFRVEEPLKLDEALPEALDNIRYPFRSLETKIDGLLRNIELVSRKMDFILTNNDHRGS